MKYSKTLFVIILSLAFFGIKIYAQNRVQSHLIFKPDRINVMYGELITDENGASTKNVSQLTKLHKIITDSIMIWAAKFELKKDKGFADFATFLGNKLNIPLTKKIDLSFVDNTGNREDYILWSLNPNRFQFEKTKVNRRY